MVEAILKVLTPLLAVYGAGLSTYLCFRDRSAIKVEVDMAMRSGVEITHLLAIRAINVGRRPVYIKSLPDIMLDNGYSLFFTEMAPPPGKLSEGEVYEVYVDLKELGRALEEKGSPRPRGVSLRDSFGRRHVYKFKRRQWNYITKRIEYLQKKT